MSFNRTKYDVGTTRVDLDQSLRPGLYNYDTPVTCSQCVETNARIIQQRGGVSQNNGYDRRFFSGPVDVESDLRNINRPATRNPDMKYQPDTSNCTCLAQGQPAGAGVIAGCSSSNCVKKMGERCGDANLVDFPDCYFPTEDTRLSNPAVNLKGTGINRFIPLCMDPQKNVVFPGTFQIPTRLVVKDNHRPCVPTPAINSMKPEPKPQMQPDVINVCGVFTDPLYQYDVCG